MIDKSLVKMRFSKSMKTYNDNAVVQKKMAKRLISLLPRKNFNSILEIGSSTGVLTEQIKKCLTFDEYSANDLIENSKNYINNIIPQNTFIIGDIEEINLNTKYDLIISNAALQWCENIQQTLDKLYSNLNKNGVLAVSIFGNDNFYELKKVLNIKNTMKTNFNGILEKEKLYFNSPLDVLKHIKSTGANALEYYKFTKSSLKEFVDKYNKLFSSLNKVPLTYQPLYILLENND